MNCQLLFSPLEEDATVEITVDHGNIIISPTEARTEELLNKIVRTRRSVLEKLIAEFGGGAGIRDNGLLAAAAAMPKKRFRGALHHNDLAEFFLLLNERQLNATNRD